jgi:hypothetical protein
MEHGAWSMEHGRQRGATVEGFETVPANLLAAVEVDSDGAVQTSASR